jgi:segregation and condensation protein A
VIAPAASPSSTPRRLLQAEQPPCTVQLPQFEGPLDLLLHLIQQHELDILDIPIAFITERYLEYLDEMKQLSVNIASEYLVMAATLAHIKSKMLLPALPDDQEEGLEDEQADPRADLVRRLLEYQKYKYAAELFDKLPREGREVFARGWTPPDTHTSEAPEVETAEVFLLIDAFASLLKRRRIRMDHQVDMERISISQRIQQIASVLARRTLASLDSLLPPRFDRADLIVTFLAVLEMTRLGMIELEQVRHLGTIVLRMKSPLESSANHGEPALATHE